MRVPACTFAMPLLSTVVVGSVAPVHRKSVACGQPASRWPSGFVSSPRGKAKPPWQAVGAKSMAVNREAAENCNGRSGATAGVMANVYGPGYRLYLMREGPEVCLLLSGGDRSTQKHAAGIRRSTCKARNNSSRIWMPASMKRGSAAFIAKALGNVARARGMSNLARDTGLGRERLCTAFSGEGSPGVESGECAWRSIPCRGGIVSAHHPGDAR